MLTKNKNAKTGQTSPFLGFTKTSSTLPRVVWDEESKNGLRFKIGPSYDNAPMRSRLVTDRQSSPIMFKLEVPVPVVMVKVNNSEVGMKQY